MTGACTLGAGAAAAKEGSAAAGGAAAPVLAAALNGSGAIEKRSDAGLGASSRRSAVARRDVIGTTLLRAVVACGRGGSEGRVGAGRCGPGRMLGDGGRTLPRALGGGSGVTSETRPVEAASRTSV